MKKLFYKFQIQKVVLLVFFASLINQSKAQTVSRAEYFFDTDKGYGKGTQVILTSSGDSTWQLPMINTAGLSKGFHRLFIRTKDSNKKWSQTSAINIEIISNLAEESDSIVAAEYFIDVDPKAGKGTAITLPMPDSSISKTFTIPASVLSNLPVGNHTLYGRVKNRANRWSETFNNRIEIIKNDDTASIIKVEYFFGDESDAGLGNCHSQAITINPPYNIDSSTFTIPFSQLYLKANDTLSVRVTENNNNCWSQTASIKGLNITVAGPRLSTSNQLNKIKVYPNPAKGFIVIIPDSETSTPIKIKLINAAGQVVQEQTDNDSHIRIELNHPKGFYVLQMQFSNETYFEKLIID